MVLVNATSGKLSLYWSPNGTTLNAIDSSAAPVVENGETIYLKITLDVDNGSSQAEVKFYQSSDGENWTQIGNTQTQAGVTSIFAGTNVLRIGSYSNGTLWHLNGNLYTLTIRNGIDGNPVAMYDSGMHYIGVTLKDLLGLTYTLVGDIEMVGGLSLQVLNGSVSGQIASYATAILSDMILQEPDLNFINYCHNEGSNIDYSDYKDLLDAIRTAYPRAGIVCCTQNQQNITEDYYLQHGIRNSQISKYAGVLSCVLIDFFVKSLTYEILEITSEDNVHPSADGHRIWADYASEVFENV